MTMTVYLCGTGRDPGTGGGGGVVETCGGATVHQQQHGDMHRNMYQQLLRCSRPANDPRQLLQLCTYTKTV